MAERGRPKAALMVSRRERTALKGLRRRGTSALRLRARIILRCAGGRTNRDVALLLGVTPQMVGKWRARFIAHGVSGLYDEYRSGTRRRLSDATIKRVVRRTIDAPPMGVPRWTVRLVSRATGVSPTSVYRIWQHSGVRETGPIRVRGIPVVPRDDESARADARAALGSARAGRPTCGCAAMKSASPRCAVGDAAFAWHGQSRFTTFRTGAGSSGSACTRGGPLCLELPPGRSVVRVGPAGCPGESRPASG